MMLQFTSFSVYFIATLGVIGSTTATHMNDQDLRQRRKLAFLMAIREANNAAQSHLTPQTGQYQHRALQTATQVCRADGTVATSGNITALLAPAYLPTCTCTEDNNLDSLQNFNPSNGFDIDVFNQLISDLFIDVNWACANGLSTCFPSGDCALVDVNFLANFDGVQADFTLEELLGGGIDPNAGASQFLTGQQTQTICTDFTVGQTGLVCLDETVTVADLDAQADRPCVLRYNNVNCGSCTVTTAGCIVSECSINGVASVNTCQNTGVNTIFQILPYYTGASSAAALTVGASGPAPGPTPISVPVPVPAPVPVPVPASVPVSVPAAVPVPGPAAAPVPVPAPTPGTVPVLAPIARPVSVPVLTPALVPVSVPRPVPVPVPVPRPVSVPVPVPAPRPVPVPVPVPRPIPVPIPVTPTPPGVITPTSDECATKSTKGDKGSKGTTTPSTKSLKGAKKVKGSCKIGKEAKVATAGASKKAATAPSTAAAKTSSAAAPSPAKAAKVGSAGASQMRARRRML